MNTPHPIQTQRGRRKLATYIAIQRTARSDPRSAVICPFSKQPEPVNFCAAPDDAPQPITRGQLVATAVIWLACMLGALWLCTAAGMAFLDAIWSVR